MIANIFRFFFLLLAYIPFIFWRLNSYLVGSDEAFQGASQFCSLIPGKFGSLLRSAFYKLSLPNTSQRTSIGFLATFSHPKASLGKHSGVSYGCNIGWVDLGDNSLISANSVVVSGKNQHATSTDGKTLTEGSRSKITIGANAWIGVGCVIMADVGEGCIIAAGSVVTKPIPPFSVAAGIPAKVIKSTLGTNSKDS